mgnify:CR=1 FL=1
MKITQGVFWILAVCLMPGTAYGEGRDVLPGNAAYKVEVFRGGTWEEIFVYNARVSDYAGNPEAGYTQYTMGFALFTDSFRQPLKVRVTRRAGTFSKVEIRPLSYGIVPNVQTPNSVEFELGDPAQKVSVEFDGNRMENLFILPDLPDTAIPMGANVTYFGPGVHNAGVIRIANESGRILYLDEGAVVLGRIEAENAANLTIRGRGVFCSSQEDHGAGRRPQMEFRNCDNLKIEGILLTMTDSRTIYGQQISNLIRQAYGKHLKVFDQTIPRSVRAAETSTTGKSIFQYDPKGKVAEAYHSIAKGVLADAEKRIKRQSEQLR